MGIKHGLKSIFEKIVNFRGVFYPSSTSATDLMNVLKRCLRRICWMETILSLITNNIMSGEQAEVEKKNAFLAS